MTCPRSARLEDAIRYAFTFIALVFALIIGIVGVVVYFANAPKPASTPPTVASSSAAN